jgi:hypothetical protein
MTHGQACALVVVGFEAVAIEALAGAGAGA